MGNRKNDWQDVDTVLSRFGAKVHAGRRGYRHFLMEGIAAGKRDDLIGGGLIRSSRGWQALKEMRTAADVAKERGMGVRELFGTMTEAGDVTEA